MSKDFILPDIGEGIVECEIVEWLVKEGDLIQADQIIVEVMTDKAVVQIPAENAGRITKLYYKVGDMAKVDSPLFAVEATNAANSTPTTPEPPKSEYVDSSQTELGVSSQKGTPTPSSTASKKALATPAVRHIARELGIDINGIPGSGKNGRVMKEDLYQWKKTVTPAVSTAGPDPSLIAESKTEDGMSYDRQPIRGIPLAMQRRMTESLEIPHFTYGEEIDCRKLLALKSAANKQQSKVHVTLLPFFIKALALAVQRYPLLNSRLSPEGNEIFLFHHCNVGIAIDTPAGLIVPNIKNVEELSILEIANEVERLAATARAGRIQQEDIQGSTITISNIGALGGTYSVPVINKPEVAIVALGRIQRLPRFNATGEVEAVSIIQVGWSADHRVVDGATMARFCQLWKEYLEEPGLMLVHQ